MITIDIDKFREKWKKQYKGQLHGKKARMWIGDKEIKGMGSWKINIIPWYLRWWHWLRRRAWRI